MPCVSGRSTHILLKKDCQTGCACCVNTAFSVGKICCNEQQDNVNNANISGIVCRIIKEGIDNGGCNNGFDFLEQTDGLLKLPQTHCKVRLERRNTSQSNTTIIDIENRNVTIVEVNNPTSGDEIIYLVDGIECTRCTLV